MALPATNGRLVDPVSANSKPSRPRPSVPRQRKGSIYRRSLSTVIRLLTWYSILTVLLRCPSTPAALTASSPKICSPYLDVRGAVAPYLEPYYDAYAAPYVERARPYVTTLETKLIDPVVSSGKATYQLYAAPRINRVGKTASDEWDRLARPALDSLSLKTSKIYDSSLAPVVQKGNQVLAPYYDAAKGQFVHVYEAQVLPAYVSSLPYAQRAYAVGQTFAIETGIPYGRWAWSTTAIFIERTLWPKVRILYGENVEPQLVRIGERLGRYRDGRKLKAALENSTRPSSTHLEKSSVSSVTGGSVKSADSSPAPASTPLSEEEEERILQEKIENDLKTWQDKFAKAADKGSEDLDARIHEISKKHVKSQVKGVGSALLVQLEEAVQTETHGLKKQVVSIIQELPENPDDATVATAQQAVGSAVKDAGLAIKGRAQAIRTWRQSFETDLHASITEAAYSTLQVIDNIRDLGLQEIGMRWAWMDGVSWKEWAKYHKLRHTFDEWRDEIIEGAQSHRALKRAIEEATDLESKGMAEAMAAAKELGRLKDVSQLKVQSTDSSEDFSDENPLLAAARKVLSGLKDATQSVKSALPETQTFNEPPSSGTGESSSSASIDDLSVDGVISQANSRISEAGSYLSDAVIGSATPVPGDQSQTLCGEFEGNGIEVALSEGQEVLGDPAPTSPETVNAEGLDELSSAATALTGAIDDEQARSSLTENASDSHEPSISSDAAVPSKMAKVWAGASAQKVGKAQVILDDVISDSDDSNYSDKIRSVVSEAGDRLADVTRAVSEALLQPTPTQGSVESITSLAGEQYSSALAAASSVLYGTSQGTVESATSLAAQRYSEAVAAASVAIYGTPTPRVSSLAAQASSAYDEAVRVAQDQYAQAQAAVSKQVKGKPKPTHERLLSSAEAAYSGSLASAQSALGSAISAASTGIYGTPLSPQQSVLSVANQKLSDAASLASAQYEQAKTAISGSPTPAHVALLSNAASQYSSVIAAASFSHSSLTSAVALSSISALASSRLSEGLDQASSQYGSLKIALGAQPTATGYLDQAQRQYYQQVGLAHDRYSQFLTAASSAVYGTPTPLHQSAYHAASEAIYGTPTAAHQSVLYAAQSHYDGAVAAASSSLSSVLAQASSLAGKKSKSPAESVLSAASSRYSAAVASASASLSSASSAASTAVYGTPTGPVESIASSLSEKLESAASAASSQVIGSETPWSQSVASVASVNWDALVSKASEQVYGAPTPWSQSVLSQAGQYAAQATDGAADQYDAVQALISDLVVGREPDFTESVLSRFSSVYYTAPGAVASSASSYVSEAYESASSVASSVFTPPPSLEAILDSASDQVNAALSAASVQVYGTTKGTYEKYSSAAADKYSSVQAQASEAIYGTQTGYVEAAQSQFSDAASSAQSAISVAIYGTPTGTVESITNAAGDIYASASSILSENVEVASSVAGGHYSAASAKASEAIYGPEQGAFESATSRLSAAVESASARLAQLVEDAGDGAAEAVQSVKEGVEEMASSVSSAVGAKSSSVKDEL